MNPHDPSLLDTVHDDTLGRLVDGRYRVQHVLGQGGLGRVYAAMDERLGRQVAIKVLLAEHAETPSLRARFEREARALSALSHPNIVTITDFGLDGERAFVVMELLAGHDLAQLLQRERPDIGRALFLMRGVLSALAYAHALHIVHRDLKPSNVMVRVLPDGSEHVAVLDFGLAKFLDEDKVDAAITTAGAMVGTPAYMSPEQACGVPADARSDVFSAGLLLYEMLVGQAPFAECSGPELLRKRLVEPSPPLSVAAPHLGEQPELQRLLDRALAAEVDHRFDDAREMLQALDALPLDLLRYSGASISGAAALPPSSAAFPSGPGAGPVAVMPVASAVPSWERSTSTGRTVALTSSTEGAAVVSSGSSVRLFVGLAALAGGGLLTLGALALWYFGSQADDVPATVAPPPIVAAEEPVVAAEEQPAALPPARDPWRPRRRLDEQMQSVYSRLERGSQPSRRSLGRLAAYASNHPTDPRPRLLLARAFEAQDWLRDALPELERALAMDPSVRGDPHVLRILLRILESPTYHDGAANLIRTYFGDEARPALRSAIVAASRPEVAERLRAFEATL
ncbi:MAG: serine/threonine-protein kinase [Polyangiales bacterium]